MNSNNEFDENAYQHARLAPRSLVKAGFLILGLDIAMIIVFVGVFELNETEPSWETWFAIAAMIILPAIAIFLIIRGFLKLNSLKNEYKRKVR